jgi:hypothetical protein
VTDQERIATLEAGNALLRRTIEVQKRQMRAMGSTDETRRLRAKLAEWEGNTRLMNGGYYHGGRFIKPYVDDQDTA